MKNGDLNYSPAKSPMIPSRAVRVQRFLEPALALTQPRIEFDSKVIGMLDTELNPDDYGDVKYLLNSILVRERAITTAPKSPRVIGAIGRVFTGILEEPELRGQISVVLVSTKAGLTNDLAYNKATREARQDDAEKILSSLYAAAPVLEREYLGYFEATAKPIAKGRLDAGWVSFRLVPSSKLHVEVLQKLNKYVQ